MALETEIQPREPMEKPFMTMVNETSMNKLSTINLSSLMNEYKFEKNHYFYLFAQTLLMPYYMTQKNALFFLLARTNSGCYFIHNFAAMFLIITCGEIFIIPLTGYIADKCKTFNHTILLISFLIHFFLSIITYFLFIMFPSSTIKTIYFTWIILSICIIQNYLSMQLNNSLFKLTKIFINFDSIKKAANNEKHINADNLQTMYFTSIGIWSKFIGNIVLSLSLIPAFIMMKYYNISFNVVQNFVIICHFIYSFLLCFVIKGIYTSFKQRPEMLTFDDKNENENEYETDTEPKTNSLYACRAAKLLFGNTITRNGVIHLLLVFVLTDLMQSYEPLTVAGIHRNANQSLANFCGGFLSNLIYQNIFTTIFTAIGALVYMYFIVRYVDSFRFYRFVYPISSIFVVIALYTISGFVDNVNETELAVCLGFLLAFFTYAHQFDDFLNLGYMKVETVGFYQILYSYSMMIWKIFGYLFLYLDIMKTMVAVVIAILLTLSVIQSLLFSRHFTKKQM